ncbi:MAG: hypothetical protein IKT30_06605 [Bacteroidaceae bacterium]|nr:hypothetical protein [Bacteroidaceae bacterium]
MAKIMEFLGIFLFFIGGGSIGDAMVIPTAMLFTGIALMAAGMSMEGSVKHG